MKGLFRLLRLVCAVGLCAACCTGCATAAKSKRAAAPTARRILFLGDSITHSGLYVEYFETFVRTQFPEWQGEILNLGLPSETVSGLSEPGHAGGQFPRPDLHERLDRVLAQTRPDLVIACYGMNDGIYLPCNEERIERFQDGIRWLRGKVAAARAKIILLTPPAFDPVANNGQPPPAFNYNDVLDHYSDWLLALRSKDCVVLDVHGPMNRHLATRRLKDASYRLAGDGVHPNDTGHWLMAVPLLEHFGARKELLTESPDAMLAAQPHGREILELVQKKQWLLKDAWLTQTGHKRPGMNQGLPLADAQQKAAALDVQIRALTASLPVK